MLLIEIKDLEGQSQVLSASLEVCFALLPREDTQIEEEMGLWKCVVFDILCISRLYNLSE